MSIKSSKKITLLSFVFTIVIVCYHSNIALEHLYTSEVLCVVASNMWEYLANVAMSFFFMLTGFLLYNNADRSNILSKLQRRLWSIVVPFVVWNSIYYIISILQNGFRDSILTVLYRYSFEPYDGPLWYLFAITLLSTVSPIVLKLKDNKWFKKIIIIICVGAAIVYGFHFLTTRYDQHLASWLERMCRYIPSYVLGAAVGIYKGKLIDENYQQLSILRVLFVSGSIIWILAGIYLPDILKFIILFFMPSLIWTKITKAVEPASWMRNSFMIYALHRLILSMLTLLEEKFHIIGGVHHISIQNGVCLILPFVICILVWVTADVIVKVLKKLHLRTFLVLLNGGRK